MRSTVTARSAGEVEKLALIGNLVRIYAIGVPFWIAQSILIRGFFSLHQTIKPVALGTVATVIFIGLCLTVKFAPVGTTADRLFALAWAANVSVAVLTVILYLSLEKLVGKLDFKGIAATTGKSVIAAESPAPLFLVALTCSTSTTKRWCSLS